jgi:O-antigen ligase
MSKLIFLLPLFLYAGIAAQLVGLCLLAMVLPYCTISYTKIDRRWRVVAFLLCVLWCVFPLSNLMHLFFVPSSLVPLKDIFKSHISSGIIITAVGIMLLVNRSFVLCKKNHKRVGKQEIFESFIFGFFVVSLVCLVLGVVQHLYGVFHKAPYRLGSEHMLNSGRFRIYLFYGHPLSVASVSMTVFLFFSYLLLYSEKIFKKSKKQVIYLLTICVCNLFILIMSGGRVASLVASLMFVYLLLKFFRKKAILLYCFIIIALSFVLYVSDTYSRIFATISNLFDVDKLQQEPRFVFLQVHYRMFLDSPLIGHGFIQVKSYLTDYYYDMLGLGDYFRKYSAHNIFMQTLVEVGLIGACLIIYLLRKIHCRLSEISKDFSESAELFLKAFVFSILANIFHGFSQNTFFDSNLLLVYCGFFWVLFWQISLGRCAIKKKLLI